MGGSMSFKYLTNIDLNVARGDYLAALVERGMTPQVETIPVVSAAGRLTGEAVYARICAPHYNASAMDGIAVEARLTFGASETTPVALVKEQYRYIDTGDPLPDGFDAVVMIEDVIGADVIGAGVISAQMGDDPQGTIKLYEAVAPWQHIRQIGEDICAGEMLLPSYSKITPAAMGAMIASGITEVSVVRRPMIGIIPTGNEIIAPKADPKEGEILEFNSVIYTAMIKEWGAEAKTYPIVKDNAGQIKKALKTALSECDVVLIIAGSSAGREDYSASVISEVGTVLYHGLAIKPGKPAILGYFTQKRNEVDSAGAATGKEKPGGTIPIMGIPGYPVSGIIVLEQLLKPILEYLCCMFYESSSHVSATLSKSVASTLKYREFVRVRLGYVNDKLIASPLGRGSGIVTSFMRADGILEVPQDIEGFEGGSDVSIRLLRSEAELRESIVVIGSHDPLIDELSDILRLRKSKVSMSSAHVGSMGGILAVRKGEAHIAGTHLLDECTGEYNKSFIRKLIPDGNIKLIECVKRKQGLILQKGNPKNITCVADLANAGIRYVNRQKGSGTRILLDYLCKKENIDTADIYGYDREEFTHTSVAALVAVNSADAGLGIYSVAKMYNLDFLYICDEEYDLLVPDFALELPAVQEIVEILKSQELKKRLEALGGYTLQTPGSWDRV
jgi:putative molybdopterin biosynthesis protein